MQSYYASFRRFYLAGELLADEVFRRDSFGDELLPDELSAKESFVNFGNFCKLFLLVG